MYPCENFGRYALPKFRLLVAKELIEKYDLTQIEVAKKLGITQAAISQYIHSKRAYRRIPNLGDAQSEIQTITSEIAKGISTGKVGPDEISESFCKLCTLLREKEKPSEQAPPDYVL